MSDRLTVETSIAPTVPFPPFAPPAPHLEEFYGRAGEILFEFEELEELFAQAKALDES